MWLAIQFTVYLHIMKKLQYLILWLFSATPLLLSAQNTLNVQEGMTEHERNYRTFSPGYRHASEEAINGNSGYEQHPELGMLFAEAPAADCYEVLSERTVNTKYFVKEGSNGREVMMQSSTEAMHYKDGQGNWLTIQTHLRPEAKGVYAATHQPVPVSINTTTGFSSLGKTGEELKFNQNLELIYLSPDGKETTLGKADWSHHTAGDDGVYVTDAWPGVDIEIYASRGALKTNFHVKHAMPAYADGQLLVRDHLLTESGMHLNMPSEDYTGNIEVVDEGGKPMYLISAATAYEQGDVQHTLEMIAYRHTATALDIVLPGNFLNRASGAYPVIIDPLVTTATASTVGGSSYSPTNTVSCNYVNAANVPPNVTVTDVRWSFNYTASGGALLLNGAVDFMLGPCRSPGVSSLFWFCNLASAGTCTGTNVSIFSDISACLPPRQCSSYPLNLTMRFYQNFATTPPCATTYITAGSPLTVTVFGRTLETSPINSAGGLTSICLGQSVTLSTTPAYGVPSYTYVWTPGGATGSPATLTPTTTTTYTVTVTDACFQTATATQTITVAPLTANTGTDVICVGGNTTLSNASGAGTWSSSNTAVAVVGPSSGTVTGVTAGTATISFVNSVGCYATTVVTVLAMPAPVSGPLEVCIGNSVTLTNSTMGGTWSSMSTTIATVGAGTGIVTGMNPGTATIEYATSPGCTASAVVTVHPNPAIASVVQTDPTGCGASDGTISLLGLSPAETYTVTYTTASGPVTTVLTANGAGTVIITGLTAGTYSSVTITNSNGCSGTLHGTITLTDAGAPPAPAIVTNSPICDGSTLTLSATSSPGATFDWSGPAGFSSTLPNPVISPAFLVNAGTYTVTATLAGCVSVPATVTVFINPIPEVTNMTFTNPVTCGGNEGTITLEGLTPGITYNVSYVINGTTPVTVSITADAGGFVTIMGLTAGTYSGILVESFTCVGKASREVILTDPPPPPPPVISSNAPICVGLTLLLTGSDAVPGGSYTWAGPNGFSSNLQNPSIVAVTQAAEGVYTLTYTYLNCTSSTQALIKLQPVIKLTDVASDKYQIVYGDSIQLYANGATYYSWTPLNGTIRDPYIYNPVARPVDSITTYWVHGINEYGCKDSAYVTIRVVFDEQEYIPNAFTPNGDGRNDVFRIGKMRFKKLIDFTIYNRWGQEVYHNSYDPNGGWDGTTGGIKQDIGVYYYSIILESPSGKLRYYKGDVTLIR